MSSEKPGPSSAEFVTWKSDFYAGLTLDNVPKAYHEDAERLLDAIDEPIDFFNKLESYKKEIAVLDTAQVAQAVHDAIKEGDRSGTGSDRYRALKEKLYLEVVRSSFYMHNEEEHFIESREKTYGDIAIRIDRIDDLLREFG